MDENLSHRVIPLIVRHLCHFTLSRLGDSLDLQDCTGVKVVAFSRCGSVVGQERTCIREYSRKASYVFECDRVGRLGPTKMSWKTLVLCIRFSVHSFASTKKFELTEEEVHEVLPHSDSFFVPKNHDRGQHLAKAKVFVARSESICRVACPRLHHARHLAVSKHISVQSWTSPVHPRLIEDGLVEDVIVAKVCVGPAVSHS